MHRGSGTPGGARSTTCPPGRGPVAQDSCYTDFVRNVTISLDDETARWARIEAARRETSVSRLVAGLLREQMRCNGRYARARRSYLGRPPAALQTEPAAYPDRDALHRR